MTEIKKRFIAGAICPRCKQVDKIKMYRLDDKDYRECVACDFKDEMHFKPQVRELQTRVNTSEEEEQAQTSAVKIIQFPDESDSK